MITFLTSCLLRQIIVLTKIFCGDTFVMYNCALRPHRPSLRNTRVIAFKIISIVFTLDLNTMDNFYLNDKSPKSQTNPNKK